MQPAWANEHNIVLGQVKTEEKSNEITAIPELIQALDIKGSTITIDAMGCQRNIVKKITKKEGDYIIALKDNQISLHNKTKKVFDETKASETGSSFNEEEKQAHGRSEQREYSLLPVPGFFNEKYLWENFNSIGKVISNRLLNGNLSTETRYYITSLKDNEINKFAKGVRSHFRNRKFITLAIGYFLF